MGRVVKGAVAAVLLLLCAETAGAADVDETIAIFRQAGESAGFFAKSYAYAVFPTVGAGAVGVGLAYGHGRVYVRDQFAGTTAMRQLSLGLALGAKAYSQIIFFEDKHVLDGFESGKLEFGADASVIAVTSAADAGVGTNGVQSGASEGQHDASTRGAYQAGIATFIVAKGGLMASASIAGEKFSFEPAR